jgi:hypothetical protein
MAYAGLLVHASVLCRNLARRQGPTLAPMVRASYAGCKARRRKTKIFSSRLIPYWAGKRCFVSRIVEHTRIFPQRGWSHCHTPSLSTCSNRKKSLSSVCFPSPHQQLSRPPSPIAVPEPRRPPSKPSARPSSPVSCSRRCPSVMLNVLLRATTSLIGSHQ